jgi:hypothetical protein
MEQLLEPVELLRVVEDDARDRGSVGPVVPDHLGTEVLDELAPDVRVPPQQAMDDLVARDRGRAVSCERTQRLALPGADAAGDRDGD